MTVPARTSLISLGVADVARSTEFYESLGWKLSPASVPGEVSFFHSAGAILSLWGNKDMAASVDAPAPPDNSFRGVQLAINCDDTNQVDEAMKSVAKVGATIVKEAVEAEWGGYNGYFADPDGHIWEVAYNPAWPIGENSLPVLP